MNDEMLVCQTETQAPLGPGPSPAPADASASQPGLMLPAPAIPGAPEPPRSVRRLPQRRRLHGRVARLPLQVRNQVNHALRDGAPYADVIGLLAAHGFTGFNRYDIIAWSKRGYRDWLEQQERFERSRANSERAVALLGDLREDGRFLTADLNESLLAAQLSELLQAIDEATVKRLLAERPEDYFRLAKAVASFTAARAQREQIQLQRLKYELEIRKIAERHARRLKPQEITPEMRARIEAAAKLL